MYDYFKQLRREVGKALLDLSAISRYDYYYHQSLVIHDTYRLFCLFYVVYIRASEREKGGGGFYNYYRFRPPPPLDRASSLVRLSMVTSRRGVDTESSLASFGWLLPPHRGQSLLPHYLLGT